MNSHAQISPETGVTLQWDLKNMLIDWISISAENNQNWPIINDGYVTSYSIDGQEEYTKEKFFPKVGSYNTKAFLRITHEKLELSFNPSRYQRPDNVFGVNFEHTKKIINALMEDLDLDKIENFNISRIDLTLNVETGSPENLKEYIHQASKNQMPRMQTIHRWDSALYKNSRKSLIIYDKGAEIEKHALQDAKRWKHYYKVDSVHNELHHVERVKEHCDKRGIARVELRLGRHYLKDAELRNSASVTTEKLKEVFMKETSAVIKNVEELEVGDLESPYIGTYYLWESGRNPKDYLSKNTYYKHRKKILETTGIDIAIHPGQDKENQRKRRLFTTKSATVPGFYKLPFPQE